MPTHSIDTIIEECLLAAQFHEGIAEEAEQYQGTMRGECWITASKHRAIAAQSREIDTELQRKKKEFNV
jgi:hypothetical protein